MAECSLEGEAAGEAKEIMYQRKRGERKESCDPGDQRECGDGEEASERKQLQSEGELGMLLGRTWGWASCVSSGGAGWWAAVWDSVCA